MLSEIAWCLRDSLTWQLSHVPFDCLWQGVQGPPGENGAPGPIGLTVGGFWRSYVTIFGCNFNPLKDRSFFSGRGGGGWATIFGERIIIFFKPSRERSQFFSSLQGEGHIFFNGWTLFRTAHHMTFFALNNHSKRTYRFRKGDFFPARATRSPSCFA